MRFFKTFDKQNNSIRQLLKKLRRHDTVVVAIAVVIALVLCGGLIYLSTPVVAATATQEIAEDNRENNQQTTEKLTEIKDYLTELDKLVVDNQKSIDSIYETTNTISEKDTQESINTVNNNITEKVTGLDKSLSDIHSSIGETGSRIAELEKLISSGNKEQSDKVTTAFNKISNDLVTIQKQYDQVQAGNKALSDELKKAVNDGTNATNKELTDKYTSLIGKLGDMNTSMENSNKENLAAFKSDLDALSAGVEAKIDTLSSNVDTGINNVNNKVDTLNTDMGNRMDTLNTDIGTKIDGYNQKVDTDISGLKTTFQTEINGVNQKLQEVFQSVSDGKSMLASALLTKGIAIREGATFGEYRDAIQSIDQRPVIYEYQNGNYEYIVHHHTDANGEVNSELTYPENQGGCFTKAHIHKHQSFCYETIIEGYDYQTEEDVEILDRTGQYDNEGHELIVYKCNHCGQQFTQTSPRHHESARTREAAEKRAVGEITAKTTQKKTCPFKEGDIDFYEPECGYVSNQLLEIRVTFPGQKITREDWEIKPDAAPAEANVEAAGSSSTEEQQGEQQEGQQEEQQGEQQEGQQEQQQGEQQEGQQGEQQEGQQAEQQGEQQEGQQEQNEG